MSCIMFFVSEVMKVKSIKSWLSQIYALSQMSVGEPNQPWNHAFVVYIMYIILLLCNIHGIYHPSFILIIPLLQWERPPLLQGSCMTVLTTPIRYCNIYCFLQKHMIFIKGMKCFVKYPALYTSLTSETRLMVIIDLQSKGW